MPVLCMCVCVEMGSYCRVLDGLEVMKQSRLDLNWLYSCLLNDEIAGMKHIQILLPLLSAGIIGVCQHAWLCRVLEIKAKALC